MTTIAPTTSNAATTSATTSATASQDNTGVISSDFETFLVMLTAQIQNQDPLNPMDSSDYATQLATFSSVEQQVLTNELLRDGGAGGGMGGLSDVAGWVGMEGAHDGPVSADGSPVTLQVDLPAGALKHELVVKSTSGLEITRSDISNASTPFVWNGTASDGSALLPGVYDLEVVSTTSAGGQTTTQVETYAAIKEVRMTNGAAEVVLSNGAVIDASRVSGLRTPSNS